MTTTVDITKFSTIKGLVTLAETKLKLKIVNLKYQDEVLKKSGETKDIFKNHDPDTPVVVVSSFIFKFENKKLEYEIKDEKKFQDIIPRIATQFSLDHFSLLYRSEIIKPDQSIDEFLNEYDPSDAIIVTPRILFVRFEHKNLIEVNISKCNTVAKFIKEIKKESPDLKFLELEIDFNGVKYENDMLLIRLLEQIKDQNFVTAKRVKNHKNQK